MTATDARRGPRARLAATSVRARILSVVVVLAALSLAAAGLTAHALQVRVVDARIAADLRASYTEFQQLAANGRDPATGERFTSPRALVRATMQLKVPARNEGMVGFVDDRLAFTAAETTALRLESDAELLRAVSTPGHETASRVRTLTTSRTTYTYLVIPVVLAGSSETGAIVRAYDRDAELASLRRTYRTFALVGLGSLLGVAAVGWLLAGRLLRPVRELDDAARTIGGGDDLTRRIPVTSGDDLGRLTVTVNGMLDRLEEAFASQRQLLDDVGHELRTPVTIVRGHLELMDVEDPDDVRAARDVALAELARSSRLLDDLMVLATSSRPDFVTTAPVDLGRLTDDLHDTLRGLADRRWRVDARADATVTIDAQRVTQAVVQLAANAVRHTSDGDEIAIGSRLVTDGDDVTVAEVFVRDTGPGIPADQRAEVLERFSRGPEAHAHPDGAGLGLAIVRAIADGHGGDLLVDDAPGGGALLTLRLPAPGAAPHPTDPDTPGS
ncbi:cell wall metabolism sensor histidine kinase WalK [Sanguibacter sp. HDW7]|uniref:sensor histidine kinase n=1 Tax=Sanguibacter sp. HDW7 TaxID=2714931 RepID=UPI00140C938F|nr:HAMP domain-containing sensor histidine kinase [Sanguibacter sp. HDW7]QIK82696.1 HAMP domain-containing histidine kinase [Sanguibacter sp. HDW7]